MNLRKLILTQNACYQAGKKIKPKGIMVHSTGANNPNLCRYVGPDDGLLGENRYGNHWNQEKPGGSYVCVHAFIGKLADGSIATYQTLPWDHRGWHAGDGSKGSANDTHISFEICEDDLKDSAYFSAVYQEAVELCAYLCKQYGLTEKNILCHSEGYTQGIASNHGDVMHWFPKHGKSMDTFRADVKKLLGGTGAGEIDRPANKPEVEQKPVKPQPAPAKVDVTYRVRGQKDVWYPAVKNLEDYAGVVGDAITDVAIKVSQGSVKYRVHVKGGEWLPYVTGYNINDAKNGYAGNKKPIDAIEVYYSTPDSIRPYKKAKYHVSPLKGNYWPWQYDNEKDDNQDGYAGSFGQQLDRFQIIIE